MQDPTSLDDDLPSQLGTRGVGGSIVIRGNDQLVTLSGLDGVAHMGYADAYSLHVRGNAKLGDVSAFEGIRIYRGKDLTFSENPALPKCAIDQLATTFGVPCECADNGAGACP